MLKNISHKINFMENFNCLANKINNNQKNF